MDSTQWKPVRGYELDYEISEFGQIRKLFSAKQPLINHFIIKGTPYVKLKGKTLNVLKILAESFIRELPADSQVCILDCDKSSIHYSNLRILTPNEVRLRRLNALKLANLTPGDHSGTRKKKLSESDIEKIKELHSFGTKIVKLASIFTVNRATIRRYLDTACH